MASLIPEYEYDISLRPRYTGIKLTSIHQLPQEEGRGEWENGGRGERIYRT